MKNLKGKMSVSRRQSNRAEEDSIAIEITDESSGVKFFQGEMSLKEFASMITGLGYCPMSFDFYPQNVGKQREVKQEMIDVGSSWNLKSADVEAIVAPYEIDGWVASKSDVTNHHRRTGDKVNVTFIRFVDVD